MNATIIAHILIAFTAIITLIGIFPQIYLNYRLKKGNGISDIMLLGYLNGYSLNLFYTFCAGLPLIYKIMCPLWLLAFFIMLFQRFYYNPNYQRWFLWICLVNIFFYILFFPYAITHSHCYGYYLGWATTLIWGIYQIPQVYKIYQSKSIQGFSYLSVFATFIQAVAEIIGAIILDMPFATIISDIRAFIIFCIFSVQFYLYKK